MRNSICRVPLPGEVPLASAEEARKEKLMEAIVLPELPEAKKGKLQRFLEKQYLALSETWRMRRLTWYSLRLTLLIFTQETASQKTTIRCPSGSGQAVGDHAEGWCHCTIKVPLGQPGSTGEEERRYSSILWRLLQIEFDDQGGYLRTTKVRWPSWPAWEAKVLHELGYGIWLLADLCSPRLTRKDGIYHPSRVRVMPFGLWDTPAVFQWLMQHLQGLNLQEWPDFISVYLGGTTSQLCCRNLTTIALYLYANCMLSFMNLLQHVYLHTLQHGNLSLQSLAQPTTDNYQLLTLKHCIISPVNTPT